MTAQKGIDALLKVDTTGAGAFSTLGGGQQNSFAINNEAVDITSQDDTDRWRQLLPGAGVRSVSAGLSQAVFKDSAAETTALTYAMADTHRDWQYIVPGLGTFQGPFKVDIEYGGGGSEMTYSVSLESAGTITFTPEV